VGPVIEGGAAFQDRWTGQESEGGVVAECALVWQGADPSVLRRDTLGGEDGFDLEAEFLQGPQRAGKGRWGSGGHGIKIHCYMTVLRSVSFIGLSEGIACRYASFVA
jgi:hypothetical protein